ncbi:MAG: polysaccharide deacetylase family protein [Oscillospiraceae bacterium]|nr:polysaccharide deacetylase family protein [Oscillospiraceae bacterium]
MTDRMEMLFPEGRTRAFTLSYDDGQIFDRRLVGMFREHGVKATFNLNSGRLGQSGFVEASELTSLYTPDCAEIATHGEVHAFLDRLPSPDAFEEIVRDRTALEKLTGTIVRGHAYPFGAYNDRVVELLELAGIAYARTVNSSYSTAIPRDWLRWDPTCHHNDARLTELADGFLKSPPFFGAQLLYVWGHSYEFGREDNWGVMEALLDRVAGRGDVWYATNMEIHDYVEAFRRLEWSVGCGSVTNPSAIDVWAAPGGGDGVRIPAGCRDMRL